MKTEPVVWLTAILGKLSSRYARDREAEPSYPEVGATRAAALAEPGGAGADLPAGYHVLRRRVRERGR